MIGDKTKKEAEAMLVTLFSDHWKEIKEAYIKLKEDSLKVSLAVSMEEKEGLVNLRTEIGFVAEKVKDHLELKINEAQGELFKEKSKKKGEK
jgi:hypothetical protein